MLKRSLIQILARMIKPPPPMPCKALAASSILVPVLNAAIKDAMRKRTFAANRMGLRPQISLNFPHVGVDAEAARR